MFIMRLIVLLVVVAVLLWLLKRIFSPKSEPEQLTASSENMRQCKYCGVHVPESTSVNVDDNYYCCQQHADLDQ